MGNSNLERSWEWRWGCESETEHELAQGHPSSSDRGRSATPKPRGPVKSPHPPVLVHNMYMVRLALCSVLPPFSPSLHRGFG